MKLFLCSLALLSFLAQNCVGQERSLLDISDIFNSANTIVSGVGKEIIKGIPSPQDLFGASKQILFGLPEVAIFETISQLCSLYMAADTINPRITPNMNKMALILRTSCKELTVPLTHAEQILYSSDFDVNKKVVIFVTGWMSRPDSDAVTDMANAYNCRGNYNFLTLDSADSIDTLYTWSAYNTDAVGRQLAAALEKLVEQVPAENIHLIGHSLGAHIVGAAGRYFTKKTGLSLTRITGLDPANPCFNEGHTFSGLQRGDAQFIDIIHSNPGVLGKSDILGDVDFYPAGMQPIKPGCKQFSCSHDRAFEYFIESVYPGNERNFLSVRCTSLNAVKRGACKGEAFPMGYAVPHNLKGKYFLPVNGTKPFGLNNGKRSAVPKECRKCEHGKSS